jgi:tRNA G18 (ribose-2'-O)-methylase SpoU
MSNIIEINDYSAPELDVYARLTGAQLRHSLESERGVFIAESPMVIEVALDAGYKPVSLLTDKRLIDASAKKIIERVGDIPIYTAEGELLKKITGFELTRGALAAFERPKPLSVEEVLRSAKRVAVLEEITDSTNIGALFRSAAALNIDAVLMTPTCCDPLCSRAVRVSMGTVLLVPWTKIGETKEDWPLAGLSLLGSLGFKTVAMALTDNSVSIDDERLGAEEKLAIVLGTEGNGLSKTTIAKCDYTAKIPMSHGVDSLNVASAGAVAFWQLRKRG